MENQEIQEVQKTEEVVQPVVTPSNYDYNVNPGKGVEDMDDSPLSVVDWILTILALAIPCAGIILYFVWAFGKKGNVNRRNYCRAGLILTGIGFVLWVILAIVMGVIAGGMSSYYY